MALPAHVLPLLACALLATSAAAIEFSSSLFSESARPNKADNGAPNSKNQDHRNRLYIPEHLSGPPGSKHLQPLAFPLTHKFKFGAHHGKARSGLVTVRWEAHMAAVQRDLRRVRRGNRRLQSGDDEEEVVFGLVGNADPQIAGLYFASVALGSPPQLFNVQVDTGSDLLWVACQPCLKCATRSQVAPLSPPFNASQSSSNHLLPCATRQCPRYHLSDNVLRGCPSPAVATAAAVPASTCLYMLRYADGSASVGVLMRDVLHLPWTPSEQPVGPGGGGTGESGPEGNGRSGDLPSTASEPLGGGGGGVAGVARTSGNQVPGESNESSESSNLNIVEPRRIGQEVAAQRAAPASGGGGAVDNADEGQRSSTAAYSGDETQGSSANASANGTKYRPVVTFGCGFNQSGNLLDGPLTVDGVMGLGRGASSLLAQLGAQHALPHAFAHCLGGPEGGGALFLGRVSSAGALSGVRGVWQQTALWDKPDSTQYMIGLAGIAVAGVPIAWQPTVVAAIPSSAAAAAAAAQTTSSLAAPAGNATGSAAAGMVPCVLDSGTSLTYLPDALYQTLTAALVQAIDLPLLAFAQTEGHFCYNLGDGRLPWPRARYLFPDLTLTFGTGARMVLPPENYILLLATTAGFEVPCIAWQSAGPDSSLAVLGDLALRNLLVEFDVEANTVRWLPSQCSQILHAAQTTDPIDAAAAAADTAAAAAEAFPESSDWLASLIPGLAGSANRVNPNQGGLLPDLNVPGANLPSQNAAQSGGSNGVNPSLNPAANGLSGNDPNGNGGLLNLMDGGSGAGGRAPLVLPYSAASSSMGRIGVVAVLVRLLLAVACAILLAP